MQAVEQLDGSPGSPMSVSGSGQSCHIGEIVFDSGLIEFPALFVNLPGRRPLVHEMRGRVVPGIRADADSGESPQAQVAQLLRRFLPNIAYPRKHPDRSYLGQIIPDQVGKPHQPPVTQHEGIGSDQKNPPRTGLIAGDDLQVGLDLFERRHPEAQIAIQRTELAGPVGATDRHLQQDRMGLVGRAPHGPRKMQFLQILHLFSYFYRDKNRESICHNQELICMSATYMKVSFTENQFDNSKKK